MRSKYGKTIRLNIEQVSFLKEFFQACCQNFTVTLFQSDQTQYIEKVSFSKEFFKHIVKHFRSSRSEVFCEKGVLKNFTKFTVKHLCQNHFLNKVADLRPATLLKKRLWHRCFPVNFAEFLRTPILIEHLWWLLLKFHSNSFPEHHFVVSTMTAQGFLNGWHSR